MCGLTDSGLSRENNQDSFFVSNQEDFPLFIVADGMGGHNAGEIASDIAVETIRENTFNNRENLNCKDNIVNTIKQSLAEANKKIYFKALGTPECSGMGTTVTMVYVFQNKLYIGHVGDSRAYYIDELCIKQITEDDSLVNELLKNGSITKEEAINHPQRNVITKALGTSIDIEVDVETFDYKHGDILIICSDGLSNMVKEDIIFKTIKSEDNVNLACRYLVDLAKENGGLDNITVIIIKF